MRKSWIAAACLAIAAATPPAKGQEILPPLANPTTPNFVGVAAGAVPDYFGSDEFFVGAAPLARYQFEGTERYVFLYGNALSANILDHPWLRTGPSAIYRFGRHDVKDDVVDQMADVDPSLDLGWSIGGEFVDPDNTARRARIDLFATQDVTGGHDGFVTGASLTLWTPTPFMLLGFNAGASWGSSDYMDAYFGVDASDAANSGLPQFKAGAGARDARVAIVGIVPVSPKIIIGGGLMYSRLLSDAADSPIVSDRGTADQFIFGVGTAYTW